MDSRHFGSPAASSDLPARLAVPKRLRADEGRGFLQRKADLRVSVEIGLAALFAISAARDDVARRQISKIGGRRGRPLRDGGGNIQAWPRRLAAGNAQRFEETLGDRVCLAAGKPLGARNAVEALDRHHIGHAEPRERVAHITFADEAAQIRELRRQRLDRLALAAERIVDVVSEDRAGDLHFDRFGKCPLRHAVAGAGLQRKHRVVAGGTGVEQFGGAKVGLITRHRKARRRAALAGGEKARGVERQQHRHRAAADAGKNRRGHRIQLHQRRRRARIGWPDPALPRKRERGCDGRLGIDLGSQRIEHGAPLDTHRGNRRRLEFVGGETGAAGDERKQ